jgi:hypothetical protein
LSIVKRFVRLFLRNCDTFLVMRKPYILYRRSDGGKSGKMYYAAFWNKDAQRYEKVCSTGQRG